MKRIVFVLLALVFLSVSSAIAETTIERLVKTIVHPRHSNDLKMYKIEKWVTKNIRYISDRKQFNMNERWTLPNETLQRRKGDCEDGAILMITFAVTAGVPGERLRMYAPIRVKNSWHACVAYKRESDNEWVWMEWAWTKGPGMGRLEDRISMEKTRAYLAMGPYLSVTSLNPFNMEWTGL